jgi:hypothetical protein
MMTLLGLKAQQEVFEFILPIPPKRRGCKNFSNMRR